MLKYPSLKQKTTTIRLDEAQLSALAAMAMTEGQSIAEEVRQAVAERIEQRRRDPEFQARLRASMERNKRAFELLSDD